MKYADLTYLEIKEAAEANRILIFPTGCTEQQGPHLPVDFDTWLAETLCAAASDKAQHEFGVPSLVLPALPSEPTPEHLGFGAGYINLPQQLHEDTVKAVLRSLVDQGFRRIILWKGCGQHQLSRVTQRFLSGENTSIDIFIPESPFFEIWKSHGMADVPSGHAAAFATSLSLYLRPEAVREDEIRAPNFTIPDWSDPTLDISAHTDTGSLGDPTIATVELGKSLWESAVEAVARIIFEYDKQTG